ncbi:MAG: lipoprotein-releasing system ATP-binding protein LolD, partial [Aeromonas veronii]
AFVVVTHDLSLAAKLHRRVTLVSGVMAEVA